MTRVWELPQLQVRSHDGWKSPSRRPAAAFTVVGGCETRREEGFWQGRIRENSFVAFRKWNGVWSHYTRVHDREKREVNLKFVNALQRLAQALGKSDALHPTVKMLVKLPDR
ncbi:hypothetical protein E2542_SST14037 [Spatholobus suberectus]|nr:hypothetical protein E2542_SST14037 [Spatholobus suberectus]